MYVIRFVDVKAGIDPCRKLVKLSDPNLWKPAFPEGTTSWQTGHEIRSEAIGISVFATGAEQKPHYHERSWELYQILEGSLIIAVKRFRKDAWTAVNLNIHDIVLLTPGTLHLVDSESQHVTQVIQTPPALSDQILIDNSEEIQIARKVLTDARNGR